MRGFSEKDGQEHSGGRNNRCDDAETGRHGGVGSDMAEVHLARTLGACKEVGEARAQQLMPGWGVRLFSVGSMGRRHAELGSQPAAPSGLEAVLVAKTDA